MFSNSPLAARIAPNGFLFAFIFVSALGYTYNFMVMFGMLLGLGMLIDGAIVVVELADRKMAGGATPNAAYLAAARRMFWPICASVGTTLAAFLPLMFWPGGHWPVYALLTGHSLRGARWVPALCTDFRAGTGWASQPEPIKKRR